MAQINWAEDVSGDFAKASNWSGSVVPGASDQAVLDAAGGGAYIVTATTSETVDSLQTASNATLDITAGSFVATNGTAKGVNGGAMTIGDGATLTLGGSVDNGGVISVASVGDRTNFVIQSNTTLSGGGSVELTDQNANFVYGQTSADILTNVDNTISGSGQFGGGQMTLVNQQHGVIDATGASIALFVYTNGTTINDGLLEASGAEGLALEAAVDQSGGGVIRANTGSKVILLSADVEGGVLATSGSGVIQAVVGEFDGTISTVKSEGSVVILNGDELKIAGSISNTGSIASDSATAATDLRVLAAGATLSGGGTVTLSGKVARILGASASATLTNVDNTISGTGFIGVGALTLVNEAKGVIDADVKGANIDLDTKGETVQNAGLLEAASGGYLVIGGTSIDGAAGGTIEASGGTVDLQDVDVIGGTLKTAGGSAIVVNATGGVLDGTGAHAVTIAGLVSVANGESLTLQGAIIDSGTVSLAGSKAVTELAIGSAGVTLSGGGLINLSTSAENHIDAASAATLANVDDRIIGAGTLGSADLTLINQAGGLVASDTAGTAALTIDTGTNTVTNAGVIRGQGKGGLVIDGAVANTGALVALGGALTIDGAVTGAGTASISGGTLAFEAGFDEAVTFGASGGELVLAKSQSYGATITGFSHTSSTKLDLRDIAFVSKNEATFAGGVLTVTDGTHTAKIHLAGSFTTFTAASDGHGGTIVTDPAAARFVSAISAMAPGAAHAPPARFETRPALATLFAPARTGQTA